MKILVVTDYFQTTIGYAKYKVVKALQSQGHQIQVVASDRYFPFHNYDQTVKSVLGSRKRQVGQRKEGGVLVDRKKTIFEFFARTLFRGIGQKIKSFKPDIIIVFGIASPSAVITTSYLKRNKLNKIKLVVADSHLSSEFNSGNLLAKNIFYGIFRLFFSKLISQRVDKIVGLQEGTREIINQVYGVKGRVEIVPNATDPSIFYFDQSAGKKIRKKFQIKPKDFVIIYTGKIIPEKGTEVLIKAFNQVCQKRDDVWCLLVGGGSKDYLEKCSKLLSNKAQKRLIFVGMMPQEKLYQYYSAANVGVWPLQESLAMLDAAACKLPFIANHKMQAKQRLKNNNALLYKTGSAQDLAKKIESLYKDRQKTKKMGQKGFSLVKDNFTWDIVSKYYINF